MSIEEIVVWLLENKYVNPYDVPNLLTELKKEEKRKKLENSLVS